MMIHALLAASLLAAELAPWPVDPAPGSLEQAFPNSANAVRQRLISAFQAKDGEAVVAALARLDALGYVLSEQSFVMLADAIGNERVAPFRVAAQARRQPLEQSDVHLVIPADIPLSEGIVWTGSGYFSGSIAEGRLVFSPDGRDWRTVAVEGLGRPTAFALDAERRTLWISNGVIAADATRGFVGLVALDPDTFEVKVRIEAPDIVVGLNDLAVGWDGSVVVSDSFGGGVYRLAPGSEELDTLIEPGRLRSPQGIAIDEEGVRLFVADWARGIAVLDVSNDYFAIADKDLSLLAGESEMMLDGVDGLFWDRGALVGVQNGIGPLRIVRLDLSADGARVETLTELERAVPAWGEPTIGQLIGRHLLYVSNPQWERFDGDGTLGGGGALAPNPVRLLAVRD